MEGSSANGSLIFRNNNVPETEPPYMDGLFTNGHIRSETRSQQQMQHQRKAY